MYCRRVPKSRGRKSRGSKPAKQGRPTGERNGLRVVAGRSSGASEPDAGPPTEAVLRSAVEALAADLADVDEDILPVFAEAAIAQVLATIDNALADADGDDVSDAARILADRQDLESGVLLAGLSRLAGRAGRLPLQRAWLARRRAWDSAPGWVDRVADFRLTGAVVSTDLTGDGRSVVLDYDDDNHPHTLVIFIDNNLGGMAKDVFVGPPLKLVQDAYLEGGYVEVRPVRPEVALGLILRGMAITMDTDDPPVPESFDFFAGLLMVRIQQLDIRPTFPPDEAEVSTGERDRLVRDFLGSPYAAGLAMPEAEDITRLWIDHAVDYTVGGPLRVSPILVELFLADWVPRKLIVDGAVLAVIPGIVKAWLEYAGDRTGAAAELVAIAVGAVDRWSPAMHAGSGDPALWRPAGAPEDLEEAYLSLPGLGAAPMPAVHDLDETTGSALTTVARYAWMYAGDTLGTNYAPEAFELAERFCRQAPDLLGAALPLTWARAIAWIVAERHHMVGRGLPIGVAQLAGELGSSPKTMRDKSHLIRTALQLD